ncbi:Na+/H+ antiporter NhaC family protein [Eggerthellaceae bacterium zg-887]|uniref:Na+/H+ antiporter NhaC family protein n=1 Tax=Xiamenia xianingshaonis TaxID=2682776 RepID=UPI0013ECAF05|nr:Na+/H+ antiporter NhaC family protein [Xiamenia xianingshaonis]NGM18322.1 Na+/H+ antiporter NhaC family protein [Eggerthellaceae bacterium zg-893]NHM15777.1 Na+/H+ antiporter NhaC family protein [Xiamenia xianingshaonis]
MEFVNTFWALVPAIVAIVLALITKEVYSSLFVGIVVGALLLTGFDPIGTINAMISFDYIPAGGTEEDAMTTGFIPALADSSGIFIFLVILGIMVALINKTGASAAFGQWAATHVKSRVGAQLATFALGVLIFVDDYFNCLTVGSVMRPVTDEQKISRAKLAYLIDATAAPVCMIAPVSSWAAAVSGVASDLNVDGIQLFISAIPYNFYSLLTLAFVVVIVVMGFDYGPMAKSQLEALRGQLGGLGDDEPVENTKARTFDMVIPVIVLIVFCIVGMLYVGGFWDAESEGYQNIVLAFGGTDAFVALPWGSIIALVFTFIYVWCRRVVSFKASMDCIVEGFNSMVPAILILVFALTLKSLTSALGAAEFVSGVMEGAAAGLFAMLPAIIFLVACGLAFATGTSWGTFGILIPIVLPIFATEPELLTIGISACLAGAVAGDHCSPISDTTIMASAGANMNHIEHVNTQLPYVLTVVVISFVCFVIAGLVRNPWICLVIGVALVIGALIVLKRTVGVNVTAQENAQ